MKNKIKITVFCSFLLTSVLTAQQLGGSVGTRMSVLGFEPSVSLNISDFEMEAAVPLIRSDEVFGWAASFSAGELSKYSRYYGWQNGLGLTYSFVPDSYFKSLFSFAYNISNMKTFDPLHLVTFYYKGQWKFSSGISIFFRFNLPLVAIYSESGSVHTFSIIDTYGIWCSILACAYTPSLGVRYMF